MKKYILMPTLQTALLLLVISFCSASQVYAQSLAESLLLDGDRGLTEKLKPRKAEIVNRRVSANDAKMTKSILRFTATPRSDLPAFNFTATTTESPCKENCVFEWLINQSTKVVSGNSMSTSVTSLKANTDYRVEWIKADNKHSRLIREIKLFNE